MFSFPEIVSHDAALIASFLERPEDIKGVLKRAFDSALPAILDVIIDPDEVHPKLKTRLEMFRQMK